MIRTTGFRSFRRSGLYPNRNPFGRFQRGSGRTFFDNSDGVVVSTGYHPWRNGQCNRIHCFSPGLNSRDFRSYKLRLLTSN